MAEWQAKKLQLPNHNFETTAIRFDDGRMGLCYHGSTIWKDFEEGWEEFIDSDWNTVWKEGKPCPFRDLPSDMRIACPVCGAAIQPQDKECAKCGIIFEKLKPPPEEPPVVPEVTFEAPGESPRSKALVISLLSFVLIISGFLIYKALQPEKPGTAPTAGIVEQEAVSGRAGRTPRQSSEYQNVTMERPARSAGETRDGQKDPSYARESEPVQVEQFYSHINLEDLGSANQQLQEEIKKIEEERLQVEREQVAAKTPEEKQQAMDNRIRYNNKAVQLSQLIKEFNARNNRNQ